MIMLTVEQLIEQAKAAAPEISAQKVNEIIDKKQDYKIIDVREHDEYSQGHVPGAAHIPRGVLEFKLDHPSLQNLNQPLVIYCKSGRRAALACYTLKQLGYQNVVNMEGGYVEWVKGDFDIQKSPEAW